MGSGKSAYLLACSKEEIKFLFGIVKTASRYFPENSGIKKHSACAEV